MIASLASIESRGLSFCLGATVSVEFVKKSLGFAFIGARGGRPAPGGVRSLLFHELVFSARPGPESFSVTFVSRFSEILPAPLSEKGIHGVSRQRIVVTTLIPVLLVAAFGIPFLRGGRIHASRGTRGG